ncbi:MAG: AarF/ABC1/UbiB kinase family protein [Candidatus Magnetominusculus sp. LBB02]|nr:AarF/ABC1/UbiB kinase family protein [Candidatus Magnetominusculus sp. LBB02]
MFEAAIKIIGSMPLKQRTPLLRLLWSDLPPIEFSAAILKLGRRIDLSKYRREISEALIEATGICAAVPEVYSDFRPVVYDGAMFILTGISQVRLLRIINAQFLAGMEASAGQRLIALFRDIPMLYKLGQIMARNPHIAGEFNSWLTMLECGMIHCDIKTIKRVIDQEIGDGLRSDGVDISDEIISEASVAAVVGFHRSGSAGVFKVIKPDVPCFLDEDLQLLDGLAEFYTNNRKSYALRDFEFIDTFRDVKFALSKEIDLTNEQRNMRLAREFYKDNPRIKIPTALPFSTPKVTAMEFINGKKVIEADIEMRRSCAEELFNAVICSAIFSANENAIFHADPHAGNILIVKDNSMGFRIALIDWSQTGLLTKAARASVLKIAAGIATRNFSVIMDAVSALSDGGTPAMPSVIEDEMRAAPDGIIGGALYLLDRLVLCGIKFPADLLLFRKAIFTLNGVLLSLDPEFNQDACLISYISKLMAEEMPQRWFYSFFPLADSPLNYRSLMSNADLFMFGAALLNRT